MLKKVYFGMLILPYVYPFLLTPQSMYTKQSATVCLTTYAHAATPAPNDTFGLSCTTT